MNTISPRIDNKSNLTEKIKGYNGRVTFSRQSNDSVLASSATHIPQQTVAISDQNGENVDNTILHYVSEFCDHLIKSVLIIPNSLYLNAGMGLGFKGSVNVGPGDVTMGTNADMIYFELGPGGHFDYGMRNIDFEYSLMKEFTGIGGKKGYFHTYREHDCPDTVHKLDPYNYNYDETPCPYAVVYDMEPEFKLGLGFELYILIGAGADIGLDLEHYNNQLLVIWSEW